MRLMRSQVLSGNWWFAAFLLLAAAHGMAAPLGPDSFTLPLVGHCGIHREWLKFPHPSRGRYQVVAISPPETLSSQLVADVKEVAVAGRFVIGSCAGGYFLVDSSDNDPKPELFHDVKEWKSRLQSVGIAEVPLLTEPDVLAVNVPDRQLHPFNYRMMNDLFGWSDDVWAFAIQIIGMAVIFLIGLLRKKPRLMLDALVVGLLVDIVAELIVAGGGPSAFVGLFIFPILFYIVGFIGTLVRKAFRRRGAMSVV